jgi:hypothetical protein
MTGGSSEPGAAGIAMVLADSGVGSAGLPLYSREALERSPSAEQGMHPDLERRHRLQYTQFITELGISLQV